MEFLYVLAAEAKSARGMLQDECQSSIYVQQTGTENKTGAPLKCLRPVTVLDRLRTICSSVAQMNTF